MSRRNIAAGNWKMNKNYEEGLDLARMLCAKSVGSDAIMILATPFIHLKAVADIIDGSSHIYLAAQNCHQNPSGAYTGETSLDMLKSIDVTHVILGHSERREYFHESNELLAEKVNAVLESGLTPIFCCGERLDIREAGSHVSYVANQIKESLFQLSEADFGKIIIAYEPIWAIGTGVTASPKQAQDMHREIRQMIAKKYSAKTADNCSILYGGSVKPANSVELFGQPDVDGGLVGGASLKAKDFCNIYDAFGKTNV